MSEVNFDLLDLELEELADLEKFEAAPAGSYLANLTWERKEINNFPAVVAHMTLTETLELADSTLAHPEPGKKVDIAFILQRKDKESGEIIANKMGQGQLKEALVALAPAVGGSTPAEIMENSQGSSIAVVLKVRKNKDDPEITYNQLKTLAIA